MKRKEKRRKKERKGDYYHIPFLFSYNYTSIRLLGKLILLCRWIIQLLF